MSDRPNALQMPLPPGGEDNALLANAWDANRQAYGDWLARDRQRQIELGYVDPATGQLTPAGWKAQAQIVGGGFGPADVGMIGGMAGLIKNYHGSPYLFPPTPKNPLGEFDPTKIGTGEGNQAFGMGAGYTGAEATARRYRDLVSEKEMLRQLHMQVMQGERGSPEVQAAMAKIDEIVTRPKDAPPLGHMYEVNLHAEPEHYLDLDKPLDAQSPHVQNAFAAGPTLSRLMQEHDVPPNVKTAEDWLTHMTTPRLTGMKPNVSPADLSAALEEAGIAGYRYLDAGSRGKANDPDATHNHVTFNPEIMEIVRRFGIAGLIGGGAAATAAGGQDQGNQ